MNLSKHFTLEELTASQIASRHGFNNTPSNVEINNLSRLCQLLEQVRELFNKPMTITSGYRSKQVNDAVGSKDTSQHRIGCAADFKILGYTNRHIVEKCINANLPYDQIILEFDDGNGCGWVHISVSDTESKPPRNQALIIDRSGTRIFS